MSIQHDKLNAASGVPFITLYIKLNLENIDVDLVDLYKNIERHRAHTIVS